MEMSANESIQQSPEERAQQIVDEHFADSRLLDRAHSNEDDADPRVAVLRSVLKGELVTEAEIANAQALGEGIGKIAA